MKAATILAAIDAMRMVDELNQSTRWDMMARARAWNNLSSARNALQAELGSVGVEIEPQTCAEYCGVDKPDLAAVKTLDRKE